MKSYKCVWEIDIDADCPLEAARIARDIQLDPENIASLFEVRAKGEDLFSVDTVNGEIINLSRTREG